MLRFNKSSSGSLLLCFAKVTIIRIVVKNVVMNQFGLVAAYLSSPYGYVYSAQRRVRSETQSALCTVHTTITVSLCTVHCTHTNNSLTLHCVLYTHQ